MNGQRNRAHFGATALALSLICSCATVSETGRSQLTWFPNDYLTESALSAYEEESGKFPQVTSGKQYEMVQRLGKRLAEACGKEYAWEFRLLSAPEVVNAFALPGGKVAIYTGLLAVTQNEDALAAVVGHEIAHVTANHGNERMTQNIIGQGALMAADVALEKWGSLEGEDKVAMQGALGMGAQVGVLLPFSRLHESEADEIGLRYLVRAGYDPEQAPLLWERMAKLGGKKEGGILEDLLATHPDPLERAKRLRELIPTIVAEESKDV